jgi:hypothetical protein
MTVGLVGIHMPAGVGMQAPGVKTPLAAAVKEAVVGFNILEHSPNGKMFTNGMQSEQVPIGPADPISKEVGRKTNGVGIFPNEHLAIAPLHAPIAIRLPFVILNCHLHRRYL